VVVNAPEYGDPGGIAQMLFHLRRGEVDPSCLADRQTWNFGTLPWISMTSTGLWKSVRLDPSGAFLGNALS